MPTLAELSRQLAEHAVTSRQLVEQSLAAIADPAGEGARTFTAVDAEGALAAADFVDRQRKRGREVSALAGIPFSAKDIFDLAGEVTTAGSTVLRDDPPASADAVAIARLKHKGMIVIGRTNMTEFAYSGVGLNPHYGTPRSPFDRAAGRIPGGSSSGAAVSVADGMVALGIGTDTGGSCRVPASYCGIAGYKSSHGRVPLTGCNPLSASFDTIGPLATSVACCAMADAIMAGDWDGIVPQRQVKSLRLAVLQDAVLDGLGPQVERNFAQALKSFEAAGAVLSGMRFPELREIPAINSKGGIVAAEALFNHRARMAARGEEYDPRVRFRIAAAESISAADYLGYVARRREMIALFASRFTGYDAVLLPTTLNVAPAIAELAEDSDYFRFNAMSLRNTYVGNFLNGCAISLPMQAAGEAPCGLMAMAPWGHDRGLFGVAGALERVLAART
ncbi:MAG: amidase [Aestuariivirga sp.]|uniref:amidase n=1 Tax=Aestuariivirga sp. TaxID=2650926 RepID=UPI0025C61D47|nr:amidase [Aestuariivirga sp.]MCA3560488.1 amidase [Aestuariivirga sp.]